MIRAVFGTNRSLWIYVAASASFAALAARGLAVPLYAHGLGATRFEVGALFAVSTLAAAFLSLPAGVLVDRFGPRNLMAIAFGVAAVSQLATALTSSIALIFVWQVVGGLAGGVQQASVFSAVTEVVPARRLGRAMGWLTLAMQTGLFVGPLVAGVALRWIDLRADIAVTTAVLLFTVPGAIVASGTRQHTGTGLSFREPLSLLVRQPGFVPVTVGVLGGSLIWGTIQGFLPVFGSEALRLPNYLVGYLVAVQAIANAASRPIAGRIVDRARERWPIILVGTIGFAASVVVLGHTSGFVGPAIVLAIGTPFIAITFVAISVTFGGLSVGSTRGVTMGMYGTVLFLGLSLGPLGFGSIVQANGYAAGFTACAAVAVILALAMAAFHAEPVRRRLEVALPPAPRQA